MEFARNIGGIMNKEEEIDLNILLQKAIELLNDKKGIKRELILQGFAKCSVTTNTYKLKIEIQ